LNVERPSAQEALAAEQDVTVSGHASLYS